MLLSVIITHYKTPELLKLCLKYMKDALEGIEHETIVADSEYAYETEDMVREHFPETLFLGFERNVGYGRLVNAGIQKSHGTHVFIVNADIILNAKAVKGLLEFMDRHPDVGIVGPELLNYNGRHQDSCFRFYTPSTVICRRTLFAKTSWCKKEIERFTMRKEQGHITGEDGIDADWLMGSALMARKNAIEKVGLLDEQFFMYFEDVDWCRRFWQNGYRVVYLPQIEITHYHQRASKKWGGIRELIFNRQARIHLASAVKYFKKYGFR